jgi:hypothetical protein
MELLFERFLSESRGERRTLISISGQATNASWRFNMSTNETAN